LQLGLFGAATTLGPGSYNWVEDFHIQDNQLSSVAFSRGTTVTLYEHRDFKGAEHTLYDPDVDLTDNPLPSSWNDQASSIIVSGGSATFYKDANFEPGLFGPLALFLG
jgi:Beta/Gamma crystallin